MASSSDAKAVNMTLEELTQIFGRMEVAYDVEKMKGIKKDDTEEGDKKDDTEEGVTKDNG